MPVKKIYPCLAAAAFGLFFAGQPQAKTADAAQSWDFTVTLDGDPVGNHSFTLTGDKNARRLDSESDLTVTFVGVPVYHYRHAAHEQWRHECLAELTADTDDDGDVSHVTANGSPTSGIVHAAKGKDAADTQSSWKGCLMTFAYWNPKLREQKHLLNPETGEIEDVSITQQPSVTATVHGNDVSASVWRITGKHDPVDVLYAPDGSWIGLDSTVRGGRVLSYRLQ